LSGNERNAGAEEGGAWVKDGEHVIGRFNFSTVLHEEIFSRLDSESRCVRLGRIVRRGSIRRLSVFRLPTNVLPGNGI